MAKKLRDKKLFQVSIGILSKNANFSYFLKKMSQLTGDEWAKNVVISIGIIAYLISRKNKFQNSISC